jgi:DNA (cytosine-5)-methyltransferase 1
MYGRLAWDQLAQTITTGFTSMGQGRYVHPSRPRTLTPHEAARLQTFPDWFQWGESVPRTLLSTMIGNAVPPFLMLAIGTPIVTGLLGSA